MRRLLLVLMLCTTLLPVAAQGLTVGACAGYTPVIRRSSQAEVAPGASNRIRRTPGLTADRIGEIPSGGILSVLYGPVCADELTWWLIKYENLTGWTAEGQNQTHWLMEVGGENHAPKQPPDVLGGTSTSVLYSIGLCISNVDADVMNGFMGATEASITENSARFVLGEDTLKIEPGVCAPLALESEILVTSPAGVEIPADIDIFDGIGTLRATLPDIAYTLPGTWTIRVRDYVLSVEITAPIAPAIDGRALDGGAYTLILGGFQPDERIVIVTSRTTADAVSYQPDAAEIIAMPSDNSLIETGSFLLRPEIFTVIPDISAESVSPLTPEFTIQPRISDALAGTLIEIDSVIVPQVSDLVFGRLDAADIGIVDAMGMAGENGSTSGIFAMTFQDFGGAEVRADAGGFVYATVTLDGSPLAAIGQSGSLAVWPTLAELYDPSGAESLVTTLYNAYWAGEETVVPCTYTVQSGDTLNRIARDYGLTLETLLAANPQIDNPDVIRRGLILTLPNCSQ